MILFTMKIIGIVIVAFLSLIGVIIFAVMTSKEGRDVINEGKEYENKVYKDR